MNRCSSDSSEFLNSVSNRTSLIAVFVNIMKYEGIRILFCDNYIDTTTVKEAMYSHGESFEAVACNTHILRLLLPHMTHFDLGKSNFMSNIKLSKSSEQHVTCKIRDVVEIN